METIRLSEMETTCKRYHIEVASICEEPNRRQ